MIRIRIIAVLSLLTTTLCISAQHQFQGLFTNEQFNIKSEVNLYECDIPIPGFEIDSCYAYLQGRINGQWMVIRVKELTETKAVVRAVSERGGDVQDIELKLTKDGDLELRQIGRSYIKCIGDGKYVSMPKPLLLKRMK